MCIAIVTLPRVVNQPVKNLIETGTAATRAVALDDGSRIVLDRSSRLRVAFTNSGRDVELLDGQAHFEVAKDARQPVSCAHEVCGSDRDRNDVRRGHTSDTHHRHPHRGSRQRAHHCRHAASGIESRSPDTRPTAGNHGDGQLLDKKVVQIENVTAWQRGTIVIDDAPLPEALAAMNRYSMTRIVVLGPSLQSRRVSGTFRIGDVETEAIALRRFFGLRETSRSEREIVLERD